MPSATSNDLLADITQPLLAEQGELCPGQGQVQVPAIDPAGFGGGGFIRAHGLRYPYMAGAMANGIASTALAAALGKAGMLGSYGAGGQGLADIRQAVAELRQSGNPFAVNLIHSPHEPRHEEAVVDLLLEHQVSRVEASAYLDLTPAVVRYRLHGLQAGTNGEAVGTNRIIAKASRVEVARRWLNPPPRRLVQPLVDSGAITAEQAQLAERLPMADDLTAEADSGGHTDKQAFISLLPTFLSLAERIRAEHGWAQPTRIGAAGGMATPAAIAAAFAMGAAYVVTGSINQACLESGSCERVRQLLAEVDQADVCMAPAADMFELGVKLQVIKRGTMFPMRAQKLYDLYQGYGSWDAIPAAERAKVEKKIFRRNYTEIWRDTLAFWQQREPAQAAKAQQDPKRQLALCCRWYLGLSSIWANRGVPERALDYQIWAGPAMGAFNEWTRDSFLADPAQRRAAVVARNLLYGAAVQTRLSMLRSQGIDPGAIAIRPRLDDELQRFFA